jgi:DNA-binding SARP family transcriptional activator
VFLVLFARSLTGEPVKRDRIIAAVWGDNVPVTFTNALQVHISQLRRMVGKRTVRMQGDSYFLDLGPESVDAEQMVEFIHEGARMIRKEHFGRAAEFFSEAIGLRRGSPCTEVFDRVLNRSGTALIDSPNKLSCDVNQLGWRSPIINLEGCLNIIVGAE